MSESDIGYCPHFREVMDRNDCFFLLLQKEGTKMSNLCTEPDCRKCLEKFKAAFFWSCPYGKMRKGKNGS